ncbi:hypothetical protein SeLEV6574_g01326 [Synchytrium endobioticum]|nr:hypothetical protein SeLEV6574_g01326 [Synchytrium endobioticum]
MISNVAEYTASVITCAAPLPTSPVMPPLAEFIASLLERSQVPTPVFIASYVYISRLAKRLPSTARGLSCTRHRIYTASLLVAAKYFSDAPTRNRRWAAYADVFSLDDVNLMERQLLQLLDYNLGVSAAELDDAARGLAGPDARPMHHPPGAPQPARTRRGPDAASAAACALSTPRARTPSAGPASISPAVVCLACEPVC